MAKTKMFLFMDFRKEKNGNSYETLRITNSSSKQISQSIFITKVVNNNTVRQIPKNKFANKGS